MSKQNKKYICKYNQPENIFVNLENKNSKSLLIDIYQVNGANPEIINIISIDVDSDEKAELFVQVMMKFRHSGEGISYDDIKLYSYDNGIERQRSTGFDFKRLYYIEKEYAKLIANGLADQYDTLNKEVIIKLLQVVKDTNYSSSSLNKEGELWYRKKTEDGYIVAASYFEAALKKNPNYLPALSNLGIAYQKIGEYDKAIQAATQALELTTKPNQKASSHYNIAKAYEHKQNWTLALKHYEKANSYRKHKAYSKGMKRMNEKITSSN
jgi:tetratricopeptide (TPR) repeat protein